MIKHDCHVIQKEKDSIKIKNYRKLWIPFMPDVYVTECVLNGIG
jgi:hypothetical protein